MDGSAGEPMVSVVMPVHQPRADWFRLAVSSLLTSERYPIEVVIVDDGSRPPVESPVDDERIVIVRSDHVGAYAARDVGMAVARGRFVRFFDADDVCTAGSTSHMVDRLGGRDDRIVYGMTMMCDSALAPLRVLAESAEGDVVEACLLGGFDAYHVSMLFPAHCLRAIGPYEAGLSISGDWDYVLRAVERLPVLRYDDVVTMYRRSASSMTGQADRWEGIIARRLIVERFSRRHPDERSLVRRARSATLLASARAHLDDGTRWRGRLDQLRAVVLCPPHVRDRWLAARSAALPMHL